jgi:hypothetical protein
MKALNFKKHQEILHKILRRAYFEEKNTEIDDRWQAETMRRIRVLGPLQLPANYFTVFEQLVWRLAPVFCILILLLTAGILKFGFISESEMAKMFAECSLETAFLESFKIL